MASKNKGKIREVQSILAGGDVVIVSLAEYPDCPDVVEDGDSFFENALKKARTVAEYAGELALADDSGLTVDALNGAPGVFSARYAGEAATDDDNITKLLQELRDVPDQGRAAAFCCVLVLCNPNGAYESFVGRWEGRIAKEKAGESGFGYDPVFYLPELGKTVAQLPLELKNRLSHRAQALEKLKEALAKGMSLKSLKIGA
ncbi:MAG: XTP/dITP diphosphatase [Smithellaceae bacterium]|nr:XTP/dITP diphosphatase [Smithellaceae bacterium]